MSKSKFFLEKVLVGVFCAVFLMGSAITVMGAPKKPKKDKAEIAAASEEPATGSMTIVLEPANAQREVGGKVRVHIYADNADTLISMGVQVSFDPAILQVVDAKKYEVFEDGWVMDADGSDATTDDQYTTPAVEIDNINGTVTMIGGRLIGSSTEGLSGKVLLGLVVFEAIANGTSNLNVDLGKYHPNDPADTFDNFVTVGGTVDEPTNVPGDLGVICVVSELACEGDVNGDGVVNPLDAFIFKNAFPSAFGESNYNSICDLNGDGAINPLDAFIFKTDFPRSNCPSCQ